MGKYRGRCKCCGTLWEFDGFEIWLDPWPHGICPNDGEWVAVF